MRLTVSHSDEVAIAVGNQLRLANAKFDERIRRLAMSDTQRALYDFANTIEKAAAGIAKRFNAFAEAAAEGRRRRVEDETFNWAFPDVHRVWEGNSSHVVPAFNPTWSEIRQLRWWAALAEFESGVRIRVDHAQGTLNGRPLPRGQYHLQVGHTASTSFTAEEARAYIHGVESGAREGKPQDVVFFRGPNH